jgi:hypothetical protein
MWAVLLKPLLAGFPEIAHQLCRRTSALVRQVDSFACWAMLNDLTSLSYAQFHNIYIALCNQKMIFRPLMEHFHSGCL